MADLHRTGQARGPDDYNRGFRAGWDEAVKSDRAQVWVCDVQGHTEIPCPRCQPGAEAPAPSGDTRTLRFPDMPAPLVAQKSSMTNIPGPSGVTVQAPDAPRARDGDSDEVECARCAHSVVPGCPDCDPAPVSAPSGDTGQAREMSVSERAARLSAEVHQDRADQFAIGLMAFADDMHTMAGQWPDNAAARNAYQVAEQRARDLITSDRALENEARPEPSGDTGQARARGELARALAADPSLTWGELIYRAFQIRVGASRPWESTDTVQAPDVAAPSREALLVAIRAGARLADPLTVRCRTCASLAGATCHAAPRTRVSTDGVVVATTRPRRAPHDERVWDARWESIATEVRALLGTDTTPDGQATRSPQSTPAEPSDQS